MYTNFGHSIVRRGQRKDGGPRTRTLSPTPHLSTLPVVHGWMREVLGLLYNPHHRRLLGMLDGFRRAAPAAKATK